MGIGLSLAGIVTGILMYALWDILDGPIVSQPEQILEPKAKEMRNIFLGNQDSLILKGFNIDLNQFEAMKLILEKNEKLTGFRMYYAKASNEDATLKVLVYGVIDHPEFIYGQDWTDFILLTERKHFDPCPPVCDESRTYGTATP